MRILLIEDESLHYKTFCSLLEDAGVENFELSWGKNSQDALLAIEEQDFDLIFMDISLKGSHLNGIELTRFLRDEKALKTPIITFSISRSSQDKKNALAAGSNLYLQKPFFNYREVMQIVADLIQQTRKGELIS